MMCFVQVDILVRFYSRKFVTLHKGMMVESLNNNTVPTDTLNAGNEFWRREQTLQ